MARRAAGAADMGEGGIHHSVGLLGPGWSPVAAPLSRKAVHSAARSSPRRASSRCGRRRVREAVELGPPGDVAALPPADHRRQVMRGGHRRGVARPVARGAEAAVLLLLEPQHLHAEDAGLLHPAMEALRQGAEILADDDGPVAVRFEGEQAHQVVDRIAQVGALARAGAARHDPEPLQPHGMVDAHAARMAEGGARQFEEGARSRRPASPAGRRRSAPNPGRAGRRRPGGAPTVTSGRMARWCDQAWLPPPSVPTARSAISPIGIPASPRRLLRRAARGIGQPLAEGMEGDLGAGCRGRSAGHPGCRASGIPRASRASSRGRGRAPADARAAPRTAHAIPARRRPRCGSRRSPDGRRRASYRRAQPGELAPRAAGQSISASCGPGSSGTRPSAAAGSACSTLSKMRQDGE